MCGCFWRFWRLVCVVVDVAAGLIYYDLSGAAVQFILDTVVRELQENPDRRFIYVEVAFFYRWWNQQTDKMKTEVKQLVRQGRLEFILGGSV